MEHAANLRLPSMKKYDFFLSHHGPSSKLLLQSWKCYWEEKRSDLYFFLDAPSLMKGDKSELAMAHALATAKTTIIFLDCSYFLSKWCVFEYFCSHVKFNSEPFPLQIVVLPPSPHGGGAEEIMQKFQMFDVVSELRLHSPSDERVMEFLNDVLENKRVINA